VEEFQGEADSTSKVMEIQNSLTGALMTVLPHFSTADPRCFMPILRSSCSAPALFETNCFET
jgi:hypothetical protein